MRRLAREKGTDTGFPKRFQQKTFDDLYDDQGAARRAFVTKDTGLENGTWFLSAGKKHTIQSLITHALSCTFRKRLRDVLVRVEFCIGCYRRVVLVSCQLAVTASKLPYA